MTATLRWRLFLSDSKTAWNTLSGMMPIGAAPAQVESRRSRGQLLWSTQKTADVNTIMQLLRNRFDMQSASAGTLPG
jgi:hypothetical protein